MITIIITTILGFLIGAYREYKERGGWDFMILSGFVGILFGFLIGFLLAVSLPQKRITETWAVNLESLQDKNSIHGRFFLGSGMIGGSMEYVFYVQTEDSTFRMYQVDYTEAAIKYVSTRPREVITEVHEDESWFWNRFSLSLKGSEYSYVFEVPKGSIKNDFTLDAQ